MGVIWGKREGEYFWGGDWTGQIRLIWFEKLVFWRNGPVVENAVGIARMSAAIYAGTRDKTPDVAAFIQPTLANPSSVTSHRPWRRRRPSALRARCRSGGPSSGRARRPARS